MNKTEFLISDFKANCVDDFLRFCVTPKYSDFSHVCKFIFTLSHGQSAVECGFSINNNNHNNNNKKKFITYKKCHSCQCDQFMMKWVNMVQLDHFQLRTHY